MDKVLTAPKPRVSALKVIITSFFVDVLDVLLNVIVAFLSGSVVMLSQALEGIADLVSSGLLMVGVVRSTKPADKRHPFGYGREIYFWSMLSALVIFGVTALFSIYFGWQRFLNPEPISNLNLAFGVLGFTVLTNGYAFYLSLKRITYNKKFAQIAKIFMRSSLIETKTALVLDLMGTLSSILGLISLLLFKFSGDFRFDGLGAMVIGATLAVLSVFLLLSVKELLIGKSASLETEDKIRLAALSTPGVDEILGLKTLNIGSEKLLVNIDVHLKGNQTIEDIEKLIDKIKTSVRREVPSVHHIQVELETPKLDPNKTHKH